MWLFPPAEELNHESGRLAGVNDWVEERNS